TCWRSKISENGTKGKVLQNPHLEIMIPPIVYKIRNSIQWYCDIHLLRRTPRFNIARGIVISTYWYHDTIFVRGTNLDKKGSLCLPGPPITQGPSKGIFGNKKSLEDTLKQPKLAEEERETHFLDD
ncbi:hypothetical protein J1N35_001306, partial [Gossypium stocksii]